MKIKIQQLKMQQLFILMLVMLFVIACGTGSKNNEKADTSKLVKVDTLKAVQPAVEEEKKLTPNDITVKLFTKGFDREEEDIEGGPYKGEIHEGVSFRKEKNYFFCYDSEHFIRLEILGNGKALSIEVKEEDKNTTNYNLYEDLKKTKREDDLESLLEDDNDFIDTSIFKKKEKKKK